MEINFQNAIELLTAFQAFLFAVYLLTSGKKKNISNILIALFLVILGLNVSHVYVDYFLEPAFPTLLILYKMTVFLMVPSLFLYIKSSISPDFKLEWFDAWHLLPFAVFNIILIPDYYLENLKETPVENEFHNLYTIFFFIGFYLQAFVYLIGGFMLLKRLKELYFENFSNTDMSRYHYLYTLNSLVIIVFILSAIKNFIMYRVEGSIIDYASHIVLFAILIFFCWIIFKGLHSPELFVGFDVGHHTIKEMIEEEEVVTTNKKGGDISPEMIIQYSKMGDKVNMYMKDNKPYLNASLSLFDLAQNIDVPAKELSIYINHYLNKHFFDFINEYRINKAKEILKDPKKNDFTVLEILYDVGFNSKSSFNTAFKKYTGLTPTQFRKSD